jgi:hypothetical protein
METWYFIDATLNASGLRRVTLHGKTYIVVDTTILKPRVLRGNKGPLYYPREEIEKSFNSWIGTPLLTPKHPVTENGQALLGASPYAWAKYDVGRFYPKGIDKDGGILGESWIDEDEVRRKEPRLLDRLNSKQNIEVSTGIKHGVLKHEKRTYDGIDYEHTALNYKPDHVAILLDEKGACDNTQGCGILFTNNSEDQNTNNSQNTQNNSHNQGVITVEKTALIEWLTLNCDCWKDSSDKETLNNMEVEKLKKFKAKAEEAKRNSLVLNSVTKTFGNEILTLNSADAVEGQLKTKAKEIAEKDKSTTTPTVTTPNVTTTVTTPVTTNTTTEVKKPMNMEEWLSNMPDAAKPVWNNMVESTNREKQDLCTRLAVHLTNNSQDENIKKVAFDNYAKLELPVLRALAATLPTQVTTFNHYGVMMPQAPSYAGAQGGFVPSLQEKEPEKLGLGTGWKWNEKRTA